MENFYSVRALVDGVAEEKVVLGKNVNDAAENFAQILDEDEVAFKTHPIEIAMVHKITFGFHEPNFIDVTYQLSWEWRRCSYLAALSFMRPKE